MKKSISIFLIIVGLLFFAVGLFTENVICLRISCILFAITAACSLIKKK